MSEAVAIDMGDVAGKATVSFDDSALAARFAAAFDARLGEPYRASTEDDPTLFHLGGNADIGYFLEGGGAVEEEAAAVGLIDSALDGLIRSHVADALCTVHSCGVVVGGRAVAILGVSGAGKTTAGLSCALAGMPIMGDEFGFLDLSDGRYSHARYPLCVRSGTWDILGIAPPGSSLPLLTPWGGRALACPAADIKGAAVWEGDALPLGAIVVPRRGCSTRSQLVQLSVAEWPNALMPSLDAAVSRDALFRAFVGLCSAEEVPVFSLEYNSPEEAAGLIGEIATCVP